MPANEETRLRGAATRAGRSVDRIAEKYGAHDIPASSPLYAQMQAAKAKHRNALTALVTHKKSDEMSQPE